MIVLRPTKSVGEYISQPGRSTAASVLFQVTPCSVAQRQAGVSSSGRVVERSGHLTHCTCPEKMLRECVLASVWLPKRLCKDAAFTPELNQA